MLRETHTRDDLDALAEEEKQAWLEVVEEDRAGAALAPSNASTSASTEMREGEGNEPHIYTLYTCIQVYIYRLCIRHRLPRFVNPAGEIGF